MRKVRRRFLAQQGRAPGRSPSVPERSGLPVSDEASADATEPLPPLPALADTNTGNALDLGVDSVVTTHLSAPISLDIGIDLDTGISSYQHEAAELIKRASGQ